MDKSYVSNKRSNRETLVSDKRSNQETLVSDKQINNVADEQIDIETNNNDELINYHSMFIDMNDVALRNNFVNLLFGSSLMIYLLIQILYFYIFINNNDQLSIYYDIVIYVCLFINIIFFISMLTLYQFL